jgi:hypothetical protein
MGIVGNGRAHGVNNVAAAAEPLIVRSSLGASDNHLGIVAPAFGADQPGTPIENCGLGTVALSLLGGIGFDLMAARLTPDDQPNMG